MRTVAVALVLIMIVAACIGAGWLVVVHPASEGFGADGRRWTPYGGAWELSQGVMRNDSDERGAKLLTASKYWRDYSVDADVALLGSYGDAGLIVRARDPEVGVDSYRGFFAGLRTLDNTLILGRSDFGWEEYKNSPIPGNLKIMHFYHLRIVAVGCAVAVRVDLPDGNSVREGVDLKHCVREGQVGLKSYQTPAMWRNFRVMPATLADVSRLMAGTPLGSTDRGTLHGLAEEVNDMGPIRIDAFSHRLEGPTIPVSQLRLLSPNLPTAVSIRGVVRLLSPLVYVEDATGGIAIASHDAPALAIGDDVEITGTESLVSGHPVLSDGHVKILGSNSPASPPLITVDQAATGAEDGRFVVLDGKLLRSWKFAGQTVLELESGGETFRALALSKQYDWQPPSLRPQSELQLAGVVRSDHDLAGDSAFALLLSPDERALRVLHEAPWWTPLHIASVLISVIVLITGGLVLYHQLRSRYLRHIVEERELLAHDLHDTVSQSFAGIGFQLKAVQDNLPEETCSRAQLEHAQAMVRESHEELRRSITSLRAKVGSTDDLAAALETCALRLVHGGHLHVQSTSEGTPRRLPLRVADCFFRIGQEAISNAVLHANATRLSITLQYKPSHFALRIVDNGQGLASPSKSAGTGLFGMAKRAEMIGARFDVESGVGGTTIFVESELMRQSGLFGTTTIAKRILRRRSRIAG